MKLNRNGLSKWKKRGIAFSSDLAMTVLALIGAEWLTASFTLHKIWLFSFITIQCAIYFLCGLYRGIWRFASIPDLTRILRAALIGGMAIFVFAKPLNINFPLKLGLAYALLQVFLLSFPRILYRWFHDYRQLFYQGKRVLVVGAGYAGEGLIRDLRRSSLNIKFLPLGFVDDNPARKGCEVHGVRILGPCHKIPQLVKKYDIELILIAIPSLSSTRMREIVSYCEKSQVEFRTLPSLKDIADGKVSINSLREVLLEDLLGREPVSLDWQAIRASLQARTVLITGGGGSIGAELCRQISQLDPANIVIIDNNEYNLYAIDLELRGKFPQLTIQAHLCSITDKPELIKIFNRYKPELVFHVAAYKQVPILENHLRVAMYNNIIGTRHLAELAAAHHVKTFVLISTDKAVNPTNIMGATKRASEVFCQNYNLHSATQFITVRFGNVLESTGSVIPLFRQQLLSGGPLTVTHPEISRYFMTIPEASQLILQAATMDQNGEIFVLDMGEPIKIRYLAEQMIKLSGKTVGKDIEIHYIGLRPGEKLQEELFHKGENIEETAHPKIKKAQVRSFDWEQLEIICDEIELACASNNEARLLELLSELVPEYHEKHPTSLTAEPATAASIILAMAQ